MSEKKKEKYVFPKGHVFNQTRTFEEGSSKTKEHDPDIFFDLSNRIRFDGRLVQWMRMRGQENDFEKFNRIQWARDSRELNYSEPSSGLNIPPAAKKKSDRVFGHAVVDIEYGKRFEKSYSEVNAETKVECRTERNVGWIRSNSSMVDVD